MQSKELIERKQYMQQLRGLKDQNIIKVVTGVRRCDRTLCGNQYFAIAIF